MNVTIKRVDCLVRHSKPDSSENIIDDLELSPKVLRTIKGLSIYFRSQNECPFGRGNWIVDITIDKEMICLKLPKDMTGEEVKHFCKPLIECLEAKKNTIN